ncbi:MAG: deoxyhypusine synthase family protein [Candidatus Methanoperedens sp.]|nr:deoxyhypusine synthase family protein [Candidatus Methanoperedens sp.]MCE8427073.1 deoxyhypusine synthase family protein [Candidatus Methanoperedens sp.]
MHHSKNDYWAGRAISPISISEDMDITDLVDNVFDCMGYNAKRLAEACHLFKTMIDENSSVCLTLAGAMSPVGMGGAIIKMIEKGFIDWIVTTGANTYHDMHFAYGLPVHQGSFTADDNDLADADVVRIYDVFIDMQRTLIAQDKIIQTLTQKAFDNGDFSKKFGTAHYYRTLGKGVEETAKHPERSFIAAASKNDCPVFVPAFADSSVGMGTSYLPIIACARSGREKLHPIDFVDPSPTMDVLESAAIVHNSMIEDIPRGVLEVGGGVPKNFLQQTGPTISQILGMECPGENYVIQLTIDRPDTGGLSGATINEGKSWGKIPRAGEGNVVPYIDATIGVPVIFAYALSNCKPRKLKRYGSKLPEMTQELIKAALKVVKN